MIEIKRLKPTIVSNRLPIKIESDETGRHVIPGTGGLVTALAPVLRDHQGIWIGWPGAPIDQELKYLLRTESRRFGFELRMVDLTPEEIAGFYSGFANEALWPLFHDLLDRCNFDVSDWREYQSANRKFALAVKNDSPRDNFIWIHDYHLILTGHYLRELGTTDTAFFLHIPFPPKDIFIKLPWRRQIMEGFLAYKLIGFQTERDRRNFISCLRYLLPEARISHHRKFPFICYKGQTTRLGAFPISIDFKGFYNLSRSREVAEAAWFFHERFPNQKIMVGVDRLDYTKGIPRRLLAFENCLVRYPELRRKITLVQLVVPSRTEVPEYQAMKKKIDELVGRINGRFTEQGWAPIHYIFGTLSRVELFGVYRASEIALITPLKDGMNLVAKEYCAACIDDRGTLILSEFAGAAEELKNGALIVNPYDIEEVADAIKAAFDMPFDEQKRRLALLRATVSKYHIFRWVEQFLDSFKFDNETAELPGR